MQASAAWPSLQAPNVSFRMDSKREGWAYKMVSCAGDRRTSEFMPGVINSGHFSG